MRSPGCQRRLTRGDEIGIAPDTAGRARRCDARRGVPAGMRDRPDIVGPLLCCCRDYVRRDHGHQARRGGAGGGR